MRDCFDIVSTRCFPDGYSAEGGVGLWQKFENLIGIGTGRRKACNESGLSGAEKRACAKKLKASGWKKGQAIPTAMAGITQKDVVDAEKYTPLPTEVYVSPYQATPSTATTVDSDMGIMTNYPQPTPPVTASALPKLDVPDKGFLGMNPTEQIIAVVGVSAFIVIAGLAINRAVKRKQLTPKLN